MMLERFPVEQINSPNGRTYRTPQGNVYKSVTTVLGAESKPHLDEWRKRVGEEKAAQISKAAIERGNYIHGELERYVLDRENYQIPTRTLDVRWQLIVDNIQRYLKTHLKSVHGVELPLWSDNLKLAGTTDLVATFSDASTEPYQRMFVADYKGSDQPKELYMLDGYHTQLSIYSWMIWERYGLNIPDLKLIIGTPEGDVQVVDLKRKPLKCVLAILPPGHFSSDQGDDRSANQPG